MRDKQIAVIYRYIAVVIIVFSVAYLTFVATYTKWFYVLIVWITFVTAIAVHRYRVYRKIYSNFNKVLEKASGTMKRGSYIFAIPPSIKFVYAGKACKIIHSIDPKFDHLIECTCPIDKEIELRIIHRSKKRLLKDTVLSKEDFMSRFVTKGQDSNLIIFILADAQITKTISELMQDFSCLYIGKDGQMRLVECYDSYLTNPERIFSIFDKMIRVVNFIENKV